MRLTVGFLSPKSVVRACTLGAVLLGATLPAATVRADDAETQPVSFPETVADELFDTVSSPLNADEIFSGATSWVSPPEQSQAGGHHGGNRRGKADKHAPTGLMAAHVHKQGEWMVEYKYMNMYMDDNKIGTRNISDAASMGMPAPPPPPGLTVNGIRTNAGATPTQMNMEMHMVHLMYGVTDDVSIYTMLMFPSLTMDHIRGFGNMAGGGPGSPFTTHNSGIGDTSFGALIKLLDDEDDDLLLNLGFSVPTGNIYETSTAPTAGGTPLPLPYPMRKGSGTFNAKPGITWRHYAEQGSFGAQFQTDLPIGRNYRGYSVSDTFQLNFWYSHLLTDNVALSVRIENLWKSNYHGADPATNDLLISTNVESFRGGYSLNLGLGVAALIKGHLFNTEFVPTLYQDLDGIQLETDWTFVTSWSKSF